MKYKFKISKIEAAFNRALNHELAKDSKLTIDRALDIFIEFYSETRIEGIDYNINDNDMLLFQYGVYDWYDGKGENFSVDLTRQLIVSTSSEDEIYQLRFILNYSPSIAENTKAETYWSDEYKTIQEWYKMIISTRGFEIARTLPPRFYEVKFGIS